MPDVSDLEPEDREALLERFAPEYNAYTQLTAQLAEALGGTRPARRALEVFLREFGGGPTYVPQLEHFYARLWREARDQDIQQRFRGDNYGQLAHEYGLSVRQVRHILHGRASRSSE